jgi:hypothetical protein
MELAHLLACRLHSAETEKPALAAGFLLLVTLQLSLRSSNLSLALFVNNICKQITTVYYARSLSVDKSKFPFVFRCLAGG